MGKEAGGEAREGFRLSGGETEALRRMQRIAIGGDTANGHWSGSGRNFSSGRREIESLPPNCHTPSLSSSARSDQEGAT
jgi:hypothetical protein